MKECRKGEKDEGGKRNENKTKKGKRKEEDKE